MGNDIFSTCKEYLQVQIEKGKNVTVAKNATVQKIKNEQ